MAPKRNTETCTYTASTEYLAAYESTGTVIDDPELMCAGVPRPKLSLRARKNPTIADALRAGTRITLDSSVVIALAVAVECAGGADLTTAPGRKVAADTFATLPVGRLGCYAIPRGQTTRQWATWVLRMGLTIDEALALVDPAWRDETEASAIDAMMAARATLDRYAAMDAEREAQIAAAKAAERERTMALAS